MTTASHYSRVSCAVSFAGRSPWGARVAADNPETEGNPLKTFEELGLIQPIQRALAELSYDTPTPIQAQAAPPALEGRDVLGCAQTGTGKTAAFALPILNDLGREKPKPRSRHPLALVLVPTRELAVQIGGSFAAYGKHLAFRQTLVYGGVGQGKQVQALTRGVHLVVATPGRLLDLLDQGHIRFSGLQVLVLDEVDRMLDMGFWPDLQRLVKHMPKQRQSLFFSATLPPRIKQLSKALLRHPVNVSISPDSPTVEKIEQSVVYVENGGKQALLRAVLNANDVDQALVFTKTKRGANRLTEKLIRGGVNAAAIHGNKSQQARERALTAFRSKRINVLVATDVAARGIDIDDVSHVVNFDLPNDPESYVHRIGRTGRAGSKGVAVSFCTTAERSQLRDIERLIGRSLSRANQSEPEAPSHGPSPQQNARCSKRRRKPRSRPAASAAKAEPGAKASARPKQRPPGRRSKPRLRKAL